MNALLARRSRLLTRLGCIGYLTLVAACATYSEPPSGGLGFGGSMTTAGSGASSAASGDGSGENSGMGGTGGTTGGSAVAGTAPTAGVSVGGSAAGSGGGCSSADCCPDDPEKVEPGACGCGAPETDTDTDGVPDCTDGCTTDAEKTEPGSCGCGVPEADSAEAASCTGLIAALVHRYAFEGTGSVVTDSIDPPSDGTVEGATLTQVDGKGAVTLSGGAAGPYVNLPNNLLSTLTSATLEAWVTWGGGNAWQRVFDFGDSTAAAPEDTPASGQSYLFLTSMTDTNAGGLMRVVYSIDGGAAADETRLDGTQSLPLLSVVHVAVVVDDALNALRLYVNGMKQSEVVLTGSLGAINDVNVWLGRSQYNADPEFSGTFHEFRIYDAPLSDLQIAASFAGGPDPAFLTE